jgi:hypothetical protein
MFKIITVLSVLACASAFAPASRMGRSTRVASSMEEAPIEAAVEVPVEAPKPVVPVFDIKAQTGITGPLGFFDPLGISVQYEANLNREVYASFAEAERKHGRVAMIAFVGILIGETCGFLFDGKVTGPAIYQFQQVEAMSPIFSIGVVMLIAMAEVGTILSSWQPAKETFSNPTGIARLKKGHITGDYGFDPLKLKPKSAIALTTMTNKEINNGRLAMIGVAGIVVQELVTNQAIF